MKKVLLLGCSLFVFVSSAIAADVVCADKSGKLTLRSTVCKKGERQIPFNVAGPQGPKGDTGPQGAEGPQGPNGNRGPGSLMVFDSTGIALGKVVDFNPNRIAALIEIDGASYFSYMTTTEFLSSGALLYTSLDCSGVTYSDDQYLDDNGFSRSPLIAGPNQTLYELDESKSPVPSQNVKSYRPEDGTCTVLNSGAGTLVYPVKPKLDLATFATPPFSVGEHP